MWEEKTESKYELVAGGGKGWGGFHFGGKLGKGNLLENRVVPRGKKESHRKKKDGY